MNQKYLSRYAVSFFLLFSLVFSTGLKSQSLPQFKMTMSSNKVYSAGQIPKGKAVILIYFDPDCEHCQKLMGELFKKIAIFKKAQIIMVTYKPVAELPAFEKLHNTSKYPNIRVGTEGEGFFLRNYFQLTIMPFTALYDKKQNLSYSYRKETPVDDLAARLKALN